jgi:hypothetical protein
MFEVENQELFGGSYWYRPTMLLTETSGKRAAKLLSNNTDDDGHAGVTKGVADVR